MIPGSENILVNNSVIQPIICNEIFSPAECLKIINHAEGSKVEDATIGKTNELNQSIRKTKVKHLLLNSNNLWIAQKVIPFIEEANNLRYKFKITRIKELQLLEYTEGCFFDWHVDLKGNTEGTTRKLSFIVFLSDKNNYEGGSLIWDLRNDPNIPITSMPLGSMIIFPSFIPHKITPVTKGVRHTLVGWIHGPLFQ